MINSCFVFFVPNHDLRHFYVSFETPKEMRRRRRRERPNQFFFFFFHVYLLTLFVLLFFLYRAHNILTTAIPTSSSLSLPLITTHLPLSLNRSSDIYVYIHDIIDRLFFFFFYSTVLVNELQAINIESMNVSFSNRRKCLL